MFGHSNYQYYFDIERHVKLLSVITNKYLQRPDDKLWNQAENKINDILKNAEDLCRKTTPIFLKSLVVFNYKWYDLQKHHPELKQALIDNINYIDDIDINLEVIHNIRTLEIPDIALRDEDNKSVLIDIFRRIHRALNFKQFLDMFTYIVNISNFNATDKEKQSLVRMASNRLIAFINLWELNKYNIKNIPEMNEYRLQIIMTSFYQLNVDWNKLDINLRERISNYFEFCKSTYQPFQMLSLGALEVSLSKIGKDELGAELKDDETKYIIALTDNRTRMNFRQTCKYYRDHISISNLPPSFFKKIHNPEEYVMQLISNRICNYKIIYCIERNSQIDIYQKYITYSVDPHGTLFVNLERGFVPNLSSTTKISIYVIPDHEFTKSSLNRLDECYKNKGDYRRNRYGQVVGNRDFKINCKYRLMTWQIGVIPNNPMQLINPDRDTKIDEIITGSPIRKLKSFLPVYLKVLNERLLPRPPEIENTPVVTKAF